MTWMGTSQPYSDVYCKPLPLVGKTTAGGSNSNMSQWAKSAYLTATSWFNEQYGENKGTNNGKVKVGKHKDVAVPVR